MNVGTSYKMTLYSHVVLKEGIFFNNITLLWMNVTFNVRLVLHKCFTLTRSNLVYTRI